MLIESSYKAEKERQRERDWEKKEKWWRDMWLTTVFFSLLLLLSFYKSMTYEMMDIKGEKITKNVSFLSNSSDWSNALIGASWRCRAKEKYIYIFICISSFSPHLPMRKIDRWNKRRQLKEIKQREKEDEEGKRRRRKRRGNR